MVVGSPLKIWAPAYTHYRSGFSKCTRSRKSEWAYVVILLALSCQLGREYLLALGLAYRSHVQVSLEVYFGLPMALYRVQ